MAKIIITRSFAKKVQLKQYEPIDVFCSVQAEVNELDMVNVSETLDAFCKEEVEKSLDKYTSKGNVKPL